MEITEGSNLLQIVTENNRCDSFRYAYGNGPDAARVKMWGKSPQLGVVTFRGYDAGTCKTKYIGT